MKFKKNKIAINESESNLLFILSTCILGFALLPVSIILQVIFLVTRAYIALIILDSILMLCLLAVGIFFILKCFLSSITIKKEIISIQDMLLFKKNVSLEDVTAIEIAPYSKSNQLLNDLWGKCIFVYGKDSQVICKFTYNEVAYNLLNSRIQKEENVEGQSEIPNIYDEYYQNRKDI